MFFQGLDFVEGNPKPQLVPRAVDMVKAQELVESGEIDDTSLVWASGMGQVKTQLRICPPKTTEMFMSTLYHLGSSYPGRAWFFSHISLPLGWTAGMACTEPSAGQTTIREP